MRPYVCAGSVCGRDTALMSRGRDVHGWFGNSTRLVFGYIEGSFLVSKTGDERELYDPNIYR